MRVIVCGGRDFRDYACVERTLDKLHAVTPITALIHGAAHGADRMADTWARRKGLLIETFPAKWDTHGRAAGPMRNQQMMERAKADLVVAFPGGKGTADAVGRAREAGISVAEIKPASPWGMSKNDGSDRAVVPARNSSLIGRPLASRRGEPSP